MINSSTPCFSIVPKNESDIEGIIRQNPSIYVQAYASSVDELRPSCIAENVIDHSSSLSWWSMHEANQWIVINFSSFEFFVTHYSVQSTSCEPPNCGHAKMWRTEGLYKHGWEIIDEVTESNINGMFYVETRSLSKFGPYSAFRITSTGKNWFNGSYLRFLNIDFFGSSFQPPNIICKCSAHNIIWISIGVLPFVTNIIFSLQN